MKLFNYIWVVASLFSTATFGQVQCAVDITIDEGTSITMCANALQTISGAAGFNAYAWTGPETVVGQTITPNFSGQYILAATDAVGCISKDTIDVIINGTSFGISASSNSICTGGSVSLTALGGSTYLWSTGETSSTIVVNPDATTVYTVTITNSGCSETLSHTVTPANIPVFDLPDTIYIQSGGTAFLNGPSDFETYVWSDATNLNAPSGQSVIFSGSESETILLEATHADGCVINDSVVIIVVDLTIPNAFSPNMDGRNDTFEIPEFTDYTGSLTVWNRRGDKVLDDRYYHNDWDGTCKTSLCLGGSDVPEGTYFYLVDVGGIKFKGYITINR
ncbi:MAG: gliding motility-associated C-terminal domain-containing protein [Crocinitomicaceae bacterium]|nr:gliding motility-associated C-terminal domain-containing protein [Crocinitomicaceae bacterium]